MSIKTKTGHFYGVGVGPGDPELLTLKAWRLIQQADVISFITNDSGLSQSRSIAAQALESLDTVPIEIPLVMPMSNDRSQANKIYDQAAAEIKAQLDQGLDVVFLCEGDPLFFGSCSYLLERLSVAGKYALEVVPGVPAMQAAAAKLLQPLTQLKDSMAVVSGRQDENFLFEALTTHDTVVIMKAGQARSKILSAITRAGRLQQSSYLENVGRENEWICQDISQLTHEPGPYFSIFIVTRVGQGVD